MAVHAGAGTGDPDNVAHLSFADPEFLRARGLSVRNALEYFYASPFYALCGGPSSRNELRRRGGEAPAAGGFHEFVVAHGNEDAIAGRVETSIIVLQKLSHRDDQDGGVPTDAFYIIAGTIYKAPQLGDVFDSVLREAADSIAEAVGLQTESLVGSKRRRTTPGSDEAPAGAGGAEGPRWPPWCLFERRPTPASQVQEALRAARDAGQAAAQA